MSEAIDTPDTPAFDVATVLSDANTMLALLDAWAEQRWIRPLDAALARGFARAAPAEAIPLGLLAAALLSHQAGRGHLLMDLDKVHQQPDMMLAITDQNSFEHDLPRASQLLSQVDAASWHSAIAAWPRVGTGSPPTPLILSGRRLYLRRFWQQEQDIMQAVNARLSTPVDIDPATINQNLTPLFPASSSPADGSTHWQKIACALAVRSRLAVITGGPGTGKTTTVIRLLALLQTLALANGSDEHAGTPLRISLAAPTGKAAARLKQSIGNQINALDLSHHADPEALRHSIPHQVNTLHRLLGAGSGGRGYHYNATQPLMVDVVVIDEASMIDSSLMAALIDALPQHTRLILLGDKDQLASVEAGAVLGNLCARAESGGYSTETAQWLQAATGEAIDATYITDTPRPLEQGTAMLRLSHRFHTDSGIGELARNVNTGNASTNSLSQLFTRFDDLQHNALKDAFDPKLARLGINEGHGLWIQQLQDNRPDDTADATDFDKWANQILHAQSRFQLLTPLQAGPWGVSGLNQLCEAALRQQRLLVEAVDSAYHWYEARPIMITSNDYGLGLRNGDIGIAMRVPRHPNKPDGTMTLRVAFEGEDSDKPVRWILPSRLPSCQTVFAMTVHKSQGSEFEHAALVLPDSWNELMTRELIYTAVTRAKVRFTLACVDVGVLGKAAMTKIERDSSLFVGE